MGSSIQNTSNMIPAQRAPEPFSALKIKTGQTGTETAEELYHQIDFHLLHDEKPSIYLNEIGTNPAFEQYPFTMLLGLRTTEQSPVHHPEGNVWNHTMLVVDEAAKRKHESQDAAVFLWAALLHDIGKPCTTKIRKGRITAYEHDLVGAELAKDFLSELTEDHGFIEQVSSLVQFHMQLLYVIKGLPYADVRGMKHHTNVKEVALLGLCDRLGRTNADQKAEEEQVRIFLVRCEKDQMKGNQYGKSRYAKTRPQGPARYGKQPQNTFSQEYCEARTGDSGQRKDRERKSESHPI